jgi:pimeloyl-ACP methyl ester carboxylesterase
MFSLLTASECKIAARSVGLPVGLDANVSTPENVRTTAPYGCSFPEGAATKESGVQGAVPQLYVNRNHGDNNGGNGGFVFVCRTTDSIIDTELDMLAKHMTEPQKLTHITNPLPSLTWFTGPNETIQKGDLEVPLNPDDDLSPSLKVRVHARFADMQPASLGALFIHCGGPDGAGAECVDNHVSGCWPNCPLKLDPELFKFFYIIAIDQRGVGASLPQIKCTPAENAFKLPALGKGSYSINDFTSCDCLGVADVFQDGANEAAMLERLTVESEQLRRCYNSPKFQLENGYNFLDYVGTEYLAHDYEALRQAIGAPNISFYGAGYGTTAGAAYASQYPSHVNRIVLDGSVSLKLDPHDMVDDLAKIHEQSVQEMARSCDADAACPIPRDGYETFSKAMGKLDEDSDLLVNTDVGKKFLAPTALLRHAASLIGATSHQDSVGETEWTKFAQLVQTMAQEEGPAASPGLPAPARVAASAVELILDECSIPISDWDVANCVDDDGISQINPVSGMCKTWKQYGICPQLDTQSILTTAILGADVPGRYLPSQWLRDYQEMYERHGTFGSLAVAELAGISFWPAPATPIVMGNTHVKPFIIRFLHDSQTGVEWTQSMHSAFPGGSIMTWQGRSEQHLADDTNVKNCPAVRNYLISGLLPPNGFVCHIKE